MVIRDRRKPDSQPAGLFPRAADRKRVQPASTSLITVLSEDPKGGQRTIIISGVSSVGSHGAAGEFLFVRGEHERVADPFRPAGLFRFSRCLSGGGKVPVRRYVTALHRVRRARSVGRQTRLSLTR